MVGRQSLITIININIIQVLYTMYLQCMLFISMKEWVLHVIIQKKPLVYIVMDKRE